VDDCFFFSKSNDNIDEIINKLKDDGFTLTEEGEDDVFAFLGVEVAKSKKGEITLKQQGLTRKIL
jgi:hypothetical protein